MSGNSANEECRHDWHPAETLDDWGTTRWACIRCDETVALPEGDIPPMVTA